LHAFFAFGFHAQASKDLTSRRCNGIPCLNHFPRTPHHGSKKIVTNAQVFASTAMMIFIRNSDKKPQTTQKP
jgi:hypothetical protein